MVSICEKFEKDVLEYKGIVEAQVTTAVSLSDADKTKLTKSLKAQLKGSGSERTSRPIHYWRYVFVGGYQIDNTVSGKLRAMRNQLM